MRRLIESLTPGDRQISWTLIGGMFIFYVAVMAAAVTVYFGHPTHTNLARDTGVTVATGSSPRLAGEPSVQRSLRHLAQYREDGRVVDCE